jgi:hypothetical protein
MSSPHSCGPYIQQKADSEPDERCDAQRPDLRLHAGKTWMDALAKALLLCDALQERRQLGSLGVGERRQQGILVIVRDAADGLEYVSPFVGKVQCVAAPVRRMIASFHEPPLLELVYQHY